MWEWKLGMRERNGVKGILECRNVVCLYWECWNECTYMLSWNAGMSLHLDLECWNDGHDVNDVSGMLEWVLSWNPGMSEWRARDGNTTLEWLYKLSWNPGMLEWRICDGNTTPEWLYVLSWNAGMLQWQTTYGIGVRIILENWNDVHCWETIHWNVVQRI